MPDSHPDTGSGSGSGPAPERRKRGRPRSLRSPAGEARVQALDRALGLLEVLARGTGATLSDLALQAGMAPSTASRLLATLADHGFAEFDEARQEWAVGVGAYRVGNAYLTRTNLVEAAGQVMRDLMQQTGETANLGLPEGAHVVFVAQVETHHAIRAFFRPGTRTEMHASGIGKALLSQRSRAGVESLLRRAGLPGFTANTLTTPEALWRDLERSRARGWALDDEERHLGMRCVAAPVFNAMGEAIAGVSVSGPTQRMSEEVIAATGPAVRAAAERVTAMIGGRRPADG